MKTLWRCIKDFWINGMKTFDSDFMNYQLPADAKDKWCSEDSELLLHYCHYLLKNYWCFTVQKARDTFNYCCRPELLLYWIITYLTVQKSCRIFSTVYTCNFPFLFAYKKHVKYVKRQKFLEKFFERCFERSHLRANL
jgi:hypothetical protein